MTWKLPLPTTPKTCRRRARRARGRATSADRPRRRSPLDQRQHPARAAGAADDRQRRGDHHRAGRRQRGRGSAAGSGRTCRRRAGTSGTGTAGRTSARRPRRCRRSPPRRPGSASPRPATARTRREMPGRARRLVGVGTASWSSDAGVPAGAVEQPAAVGQRPVLGLPRLDVLDLEQEVGVLGGLGGEVEHHGRARSAGAPAPGRRPRRRRPVTQWIGASKWVPVCSPVVMLFQYQAGPRSSYRLISCSANGPVSAERLGQLQDRRLLGQRRGQVDHLDRAVTHAVHKAPQHRHVILLGG